MRRILWASIVLLLLAAVLAAVLAACGPADLVLPCAQDAECVEAECSQCATDQDCINKCGAEIDVPEYFNQETN